MTSSIFAGLIFLGFILPIVAQVNNLQQLYENQIQKEFFASNVYLTFAHRLATRGVYHGFANFFFESAEEEREHGMKLLDFYNIRNREISLQQINIDDDLASMTDLTKIIEKANILEQDVYNNLIAVRQAANSDRDYPTAHFIEQQMLEEQTTALKYMNDLVARIQRNANNSTIVLQMLDQDLRKKQVKKA